MATKKILIVDDDMTLLDLIEYRFEERGYEVIRCADGQSAVDQCGEETPDVILVDLMMPKMSGRECIEQLRANGVAVPIVAFTAVDDQEVHDEARAAGCTMVLTKPCKLSILFEQIETLVNSGEPPPHT